MDADVHLGPIGNGARRLPQYRRSGRGGVGALSVSGRPLRRWVDRVMFIGTVGIEGVGVETDTQEHRAIDSGKNVPAV